MNIEQQEREHAYQQAIESDRDDAIEAEMVRQFEGVDDRIVDLIVYKMQDDAEFKAKIESSIEDIIAEKNQ
jgi:hypothetical protein